MGNNCLLLGRLPDSYEKAALSHLSSLGLARKHWLRGFDLALHPWTQCSDDEGYIDLLCHGSVVTFLEFTAALEGLSSQAAITRSRFRHLPYWLCSFWLPVALPEPKVPVLTDEAGFPIFFGTLQGLLDDLLSIAALAPASVGAPPESYSRDGPEPPGDDESLYPEALMVRWVWWGLHDGASEALQRKIPMSGV